MEQNTGEKGDLLPGKPRILPLSQARVPSREKDRRAQSREVRKLRHSILGRVQPMPPLQTLRKAYCERKEDFYHRPSQTLHEFASANSFNRTWFFLSVFPL
jgi:hypothetical protein